MYLLLNWIQKKIMKILNDERGSVTGNNLSFAKDHYVVISHFSIGLNYTDKLNSDNFSVSD